MFKDFIKRYAYLYLIIAILGLTTIGCSDDNTNNPPENNEVLELIKYLEGTDVKPTPMINNVPFIVKSTDVNNAILTDANWAIIDLRAADDYNNDHIKGAANVKLMDLLTYYKTNDLASKEKVVIVCYTGQTASFGASALRMSGFDNVFSMKWGMSSWNKSLDKWTSNTSNKGQAVFETTNHDKPAEGEYPQLNTGKTTGKEIADARLNQILIDGFDAAKISVDQVLQDPSKYFVVNFWPESRYLDPGHVPGAYCYQPKSTKDCEFLSTEYLKTLPTDKTIVVYCYTGQTSAYVTAYLRTLGYNVKSLLFGANNLIYDKLKERGWTIWNAETDAHDYELVTE
jgi:rhodanese-related sulfurtransferase